MTISSKKIISNPLAKRCYFVLTNMRQLRTRRVKSLRPLRHFASIITFHVRTFLRFITDGSRGLI